MPPGLQLPQLPPSFNPATAGQGGSALIQAMMQHRTTQKHAAHFHHPPTIPLSYPGGPGAGLLGAIRQQLASRGAGRALGAAPVGGGMPGGY